ncbi:PREDICTED: uncharacterized protein LOC109234732 [Nicotiana attenuata]|uniref:uncharacterized protein LOC109234732 n=1 Tax=Nicotiana attenuata TaxID=49451 RepID=UPI00090518E8|nr:PREDICTED: uncharacterized protein LOC109234732 [Nicotiana attenuata]
MIKLNTDGCSKGNPGTSGGGGVRGHQGEVITVFTAPFGIQSNNAAESMALCAGLEWCMDQGINKICVDLDSLEANRVADALAKEGLERTNTKWISLLKSFQVKLEPSGTC